MIGRRDDGHGARGRIAVGVGALALIATAAGAAFRPDETVSPPRIPRAALAASHLWSAEQVSALIGLVQEARLHGLDPEDFGLAALRSELEQTATLYRARGSRQLDALARASALALARAYGQRTPDEASLAIALRTNRLRDWIGAPAVSVAGRG